MEPKPKPKPKFKVGDVVTNSLTRPEYSHIPGIICNVRLSPDNKYLYDLVWKDGDHVYDGFHEDELFLYPYYHDFEERIEDRLG